MRAYCTGKENCSNSHHPTLKVIGILIDIKQKQAFSIIKNEHLIYLTRILANIRILRDASDVRRSIKKT